MAIDIPEAAIDEIAARLCQTILKRNWESCPDSLRFYLREGARLDLEAALPHLIPVITADLRAQVEAEIRADEREKTIQYLITEAENYDLWFVRFRDRLDEDIVVFLKRYAANPVREEDLIARAEGADATE